MIALEFRALGPLEVRRGGDLVGITAPLQRTLLSLLLLRADEPIAQSELMEMLWEGEIPRTGRASLQNQIHALRRALGAEAVVRAPAGYVLRVESGGLDVQRFRAMVSAAINGAAAARAAALREALGLWRGPAFPDVAANRWARPLVARLEEERLTALEDRIEAELEIGEHAALVAELEELVATHPLRERLWSQLMLALYRAGRQADALTAYRRAHNALLDGLGLEPGVVLRELQRAILFQDPALDDPRNRLGTTLERAAAVLPREPRDRAQSLYEYGDALIRVGELRQAESTLGAARRLAEAAGDRGLQERVRLLLSYLSVFADGGSFARHRVAAESAAKVFEEIGDRAGLAFALAHEAHMRRDTGDAAGGHRLALRAAELAAEVGDRTVATKCRRMAVGCAALGPMPVTAALAMCRREDGHMDKGDSFTALVAAWLLAQEGCLCEARVSYERELARLRADRMVLPLSVGYVYAALAERAGGDLRQAAAYLRESYELVRAGEVRGEISAVTGELACVLALVGDHRNASRFALESRELSTTGDAVSEIISRRAVALVATHDGRYEDAVALSDDARDRVERTDWLTVRGETFEEAGIIRRRAGDAAGAERALRRAYELYGQKGNVAGADRARRALSRFSDDGWLASAL